MSRTQLVAGAPVALAVSRFRFANLRRLRPRPVALASVPADMPRILSSESYSHGLTQLVLAYGYPLTVNKPLIEVETDFSQEQPATPLEQVIARAEYRDVLYADHLQLETTVEPFGSHDVPVPARPYARSDRVLTVDGDEQSALVISSGSYAALRFHQAAVTVTAVARLGFQETLAFRTTDDLEPYFHGYTRFVLGWLRKSA